MVLLLLEECGIAQNPRMMAGGKPAPQLSLIPTVRVDRNTVSVTVRLP